MNRKFLKRLIYITIAILILIVAYKIYLHFHEADFRGNNYENVKKLNTIEIKDKYSFAVVGSAENSIDIFQNRIIQNINSNEDIMFAISTGNAVLDGAEDKYQILNNALKKLQVPTIIGIGNHEISDGGDRRFYKHYGAFYFAYTYGDSYFIFLDTTGKTSFDYQKEWLQGELNKADSYRHTFVFMNDSPLKSGAIKDTSFGEFLINEFSKHEVTGVFTNGADFEKETKKNISYYSSGGAGGLFLGNYSNNNYHFLKVNVTVDGITVSSIKEPLISNNYVIQKIERMWIFIHSVFYAQFTNILLAVFLLLLVFLVLYAKVSKDVNYYGDFNNREKQIEADRKLNIAMFTNNYLPFVGGVPISIQRLADALRKRGHTVVIFAPEYPGVNKEEENVIRCKLLHFRKTKKFNFAIANIYNSEIEQEFIKNKFDVVHVHHPFWMGKKGLELGKKYNLPVVLTYHTRLEMYADNLPVFKLVFKNIISHRMIRKFAQECNGIIAPTASAKEYLTNVGVSRQKLVLPTGVDLRKYEVTDENEIRMIKEKYAPEGEVLLCSVSRLAGEKNIDFLIQGLKWLKENATTKFKCILIGTGPEKEHLQQLINEYKLEKDVILIGSIPPEDVPQYYMASDIFVFCSLSETQGMVLIEAMAGKCPVVSVRSSGTDDVVRNDFNGYKTPEDVVEWSTKVKMLLEDEALRDTMRVNAFHYAQNFSLDKMAERVELFYKKLMITNEQQPREK